MKHALPGIIGVLVAVLFLWFLAHWKEIPLTKEDGVALIMTASLMLIIVCMGALKKGT